MKFFNLGLPKSGNDIVKKALNRAGWRCANWYMADSKQYVGHGLYHDYLSGQDPLNSLSRFDAVTQADVMNDQGSFWPQMDLSLLRTVREYHPDCALVLLRRHPDDLLAEIDRMSDFRERLTRWGAPGLPAGAAKFDQMMLAWIENHYDAMQVAFGTDPRFFVLDMDRPDAQARLGRILSVDLPWWDSAQQSRRAA